MGTLEEQWKGSVECQGRYMGLIMLHAGMTTNDMCDTLSYLILEFQTA